MGCGASGAAVHAHGKVAPMPHPVRRTKSIVDESFDDIMCKSRYGVNDDGDAPEFITPTKSISAPPVLGIVYENLSPKSWTYDYPSVPEGMRIPVPPNRTMHDKHVKEVNHFLAEVEKKPETLKMAVGLRREVDEILNDRMDNRAWGILP